MTDDEEREHVPWRELLRRRHAAPLALVCLGVWLHAADGLVVATMLPTIVAEIGGTELMPWSIVLYEIGSIVVGAASGLLAARAGVVRPMVAAAALYALGCAVSAMAPRMDVLLAGRLAQGLGGGGLAALSFVAVGTLFPRRTMARVMALVSTAWMASALSGPMIGGAFVTLSSWRAGFWFFAVQAVALAVWLLGRGGATLAPVDPSIDLPIDPAGVSDDAPVPARRFPVVPLLLLVAGIAVIASVGVDVASVPMAAALLLAGALLLAAFLRVDARGGEARLLPDTASDPRHLPGAALATVLCFAAATIATSLYGPLLMMRLHGASALTAGAVLVAEAVAWSVAAALVSGAPERRDPTLIGGGLLIVAASVVGLAWSVAHGPILAIAVCTMLQGGGFGTAWTFVLRRAVAAVPPGDVERMSAAVPTVQRAGYALGAAYVGIVANALGLADATAPRALERIASVLFLASLVPAAAGLWAMRRFLRS